MARKRNSEPARFGSFLEYCVKHPDDLQGTPLLEAVLDPDGLAKALDRYSAAKRAKEALAASQATEAARQEGQKEIEALKRAMEGLKKGKSTDGRCRLWTLFGLSKQVCHKQGRRFNLAHLARWVDPHLAKEGGLGAVCPASWLEVDPIPATASEALCHPVLQKRVRSFISRAQVVS
jgi:hypothetical protein